MTDARPSVGAAEGREVGLNERQERFCLHLFVGENATEAYRKAGYGPTNDNSAFAAASRLLRSVKVAARMRELRMAQEKRIEVTADWVVQGLAHEATLDGEGASHSARVAAYRTLAQIKGMIVQKNEHSGPDGGPIEWIEVADDGDEVPPAPPAAE